LIDLAGFECEQYDRDLIAQESLKRARVAGKTVFLVHLDGDELLNSKDQSSLSELLKNVPDWAETIWMQNFEAKFHENESCFEAKTYLDCKKDACLSYANGKSIAVIRDTTQPDFNGPHMFTGRQYNIAPELLHVRHYDSCTPHTLESTPLNSQALSRHGRPSLPDRSDPTWT